SGDQSIRVQNGQNAKFAEFVSYSPGTKQVTLGQVIEDFGYPTYIRAIQLNSFSTVNLIYPNQGFAVLLTYPPGPKEITRPYDHPGSIYVTIDQNLTGKGMCAHSLCHNWQGFKTIRSYLTGER